MPTSLLTVGELMSSAVITLRENASVGRAHAEMKLARIRHFPVVNGDGQVVGIVSSLDVAKALAVPGRGRSTPVRLLMSTEVQTVFEDAPAHLAPKLMREKKIGALPVVDREGSLVGIITETDFLRVAEQALKGTPVRRARP